jgi:radical SAM/Cys-rich protein
MAAVVACARRFPFAAVDLTGGAPELVPGLPLLIEQLAPLTPKLLLRSNLTALDAAGADALLALCRAHRVTLVASFPATNAAQAEAQRGEGVFARSVAMLQRLNACGYGVPGSGLELHLVANPAGAFLPAAQKATEARFRRDAERRWGIVFNHLFTFANAPLGRFRRWLETSGNYATYMQKLAQSFNPCTVEGLMCRTLLSVDWDGTLYDCDFNLAAGLPLGGTRRHVAELAELPATGTPIATGEHCYACTAGSGFT